MGLEPFETEKINNFRKNDRLNNICFSVLMALILIFLIINIIWVSRLASEFNIPPGRIMQLFKHVELHSGVEWYEVHIIRRLGYIIIGTVILLFFPLFYIMGRNEMLLAVRCHEAYGKAKSNNAEEK